MLVMEHRPRGMPENSTSDRRRAYAAQAVSNFSAANHAASNPFPQIPVPPIPFERDALSTSSLSATQPLSPIQVIALARDAMQAALKDNESQAAEASGVSDDLKPGVTIDLSRKGIRTLPEEVVDIIKNELERLALSHNYLTSFPARFAECTSLRYLNVRQNKIREFPVALCDLKSLEILDLGRNRLQSLPPDIVKMSSLKVFAFQKNMIRELPLCLGEMASLQVLKIDGNPISFPPVDVLQVQVSSPPSEGILKDSEVSEVTVTMHIKKYLKQKLSGSSNLLVDLPQDDMAEGIETPRLPPFKRQISGRFPIKVHGMDGSDLRSPNLGLPKPPPIPTRSHYRGLSQQNAAMRRPNVMPLTLSNFNERLRSNSETALQATRADRPESRLRRMGIVNKKSELSTLDETQANNRFSHYRGLSHGSAMQGNGVHLDKKPDSPAEIARPVYVRRLSVLPEQRHEPKVFDRVLESAKGVLYSVFQIHPTIQLLLNLANDGSTKRSSLEYVFYNTNGHVEALEMEIQKHDEAAELDDLDQPENENVHRACVTLLRAYIHICATLADSVDTFITNGDSRFIRSLMTQLFNSIMELRVTVMQIARGQENGPHHRPALEDTLRPQPREASLNPNVDRWAYAKGRIGPNTVYQPSNLRVTTDAPVAVPHINGSGRTATITSATPRSGESWNSGSTGRGGGTDFSEEDRVFEHIFLSLQKVAEMVKRQLPLFSQQIVHALREAQTRRAPDHVVRSWKILVTKCNTSIQHTEQLKLRLSSIKLKEPGVRCQPHFWALCSSFVDAFAELLIAVQEVQNDVVLPPDTKPRLRPIHISMKETAHLMNRSPWSYYMTPTTSLAGTVSSSYSGSATPGPMPMTPQSAALGPAGQATVPSTPQSGAFAAAFSGNVFERADALLSMGGRSMPRTGMMKAGSTVSSNSLNGSFAMQSGGAYLLQTGGPHPQNGHPHGGSLNGSLSSQDGGGGPGPPGSLPFRLTNYGSNGSNGF